MVNCNKGVPEFPDNTTEESFSTHENVVLGTDSDTDEDDIALAGYEPLPLAPTDDVNQEDSDDSDEDSGVDSGGQPSDDNLPPINRIDNALVREIWSAPPPPALDITMDNDKVNEVKQAMINITLPPGSIPEWANSIPEEGWKQHLISRLNDLQRNSK